MHETAGVGIIHRIGNRGDQFGRPSVFEPRIRQSLLERASFDVLHYHVGRPVLAAPHVVNGDDWWVL